MTDVNDDALERIHLGFSYEMVGRATAATYESVVSRNGLAGGQSSLTL